jgi:hypothetical protein
MENKTMVQKLNEMREKNRRKIRWGAVGLLCMFMMMLALNRWDMVSYVQSWIGTSFKALSGGFIGWMVSRYVVELKLSEISEEHRPLAALSQAIVIGAFALALATGA